MRWLLANGIEVVQLKKSHTVGSQTFDPGSYVVFMDQALRGLAYTALSIGMDVSPRISTSTPRRAPGATASSGAPTSSRSPRA